MQNAQLLHQIQSEILATSSRLSDLLAARIALQTGDATLADIFAAGLYPLTIAEEPVYDVVDEFEEMAKRDAYFMNLERMQYE